MKEDLVLEIKAPGYKKNEIQIEFDNRYLIISANSEKYGSSYLAETIPQAYEITSTSAKLEDGILEIRIPQKPKETRVVQIQ